MMGRLVTWIKELVNPVVATHPYHVVPHIKTHSYWTIHVSNISTIIFFFHFKLYQFYSFKQMQVFIIIILIYAKFVDRKTNKIVTHLCKMRISWIINFLICWTDNHEHWDFLMYQLNAHSYHCYSLYSGAYPVPVGGPLSRGHR